GETLWRIDAGFGGTTAVLDENKGHVTVFTPYDPERKDYRQFLRQLRLTDGETLWSREYAMEDEMLQLAGSQGVVFLYRQPYQASEGRISALDAATGEPLWEWFGTERFL